MGIHRPNSASDRISNDRVEYRAAMVSSQTLPETRPLMVIIFHLSVADLVQGISLIPITIFKVLERKLFVGSHLIHECIDVCKQGGKYLVSVSIVTLATLTVLKMLRVTPNKWLIKSTIKKICRTYYMVSCICVFLH